MEGHPYPSFPDSGDTSPQFREIDGENPITWDETPPPIAARVKVMCSYGGRIHPRPHDHLLSYIGGETKILAVDRSIRFQSFLAKLASLLGVASPDEICIKYQIPGEDLDALISVINDEDLDHMMMEYDRLQLSSSKPSGRLRLFLFPANPSIGSSLHPPPPPPPLNLVPDFLSGNVPPPPSMKAKEAQPEPPLVVDPLPSDGASARSDLAKHEWPQILGETVVSPLGAEVNKPNEEIQMSQIGDNEHQPQANMQRNGSDETLARVFHYVPKVQDMAPPAPAPAPALPVTSQIPAASYWPEQLAFTGGRFTSGAGGEQTVYLVPASHCMYPPSAGQGYFTAALPTPGAAFSRAVPPAIYTVPPPPPQPVKVIGTQHTEGYTAAAQVAYNSTGRSVFYSGAVPTYQPVNSVGPNTEPKMTNPSQIS